MRPPNLNHPLQRPNLQQNHRPWRQILRQMRQSKRRQPKERPSVPSSKRGNWRKSRHRLLLENQRPSKNLIWKRNQLRRHPLSRRKATLQPLRRHQPDPRAQMAQSNKQKGKQANPTRPSPSEDGQPNGRYWLPKHRKKKRLSRNLPKIKRVHRNLKTRQKKPLDRSQSPSMKIDDTSKQSRSTHCRGSRRISTLPQGKRRRPIATPRRAAIAVIPDW